MYCTSEDMRFKERQIQMQIMEVAKRNTKLLCVAATVCMRTVTTANYVTMCIYWLGLRTKARRIRESWQLFRLFGVFISQTLNRKVKA